MNVEKIENMGTEEHQAYERQAEKLGLICTCSFADRVQNNNSCSYCSLNNTKTKTEHLNIEEIKKGRDSGAFYCQDDVVNRDVNMAIDFLLNEVSRLKHPCNGEIEYEAAILSERQNTANICAEIADNQKYNAHSSPSDYEDACLDIYYKIMETFNLGD